MSFLDPIGSLADGPAFEVCKKRDSTLFKEKRSAQCPTALPFDPEPMQGSPAGTTAEGLRQEKRCQTSMARIAQLCPRNAGVINIEAKSDVRTGEANPLESAKLG